MTLFFLLIMLCVGSIYGDIPTCQALQSLQEVCAQGAITFVLNAHADDHASLIEKSITKPFVLADINFESDVYFSPTEFDYLVDLRKGDVVTAQHIKKAVSYLFKKNKFSTISLTIRCCEQGNTIKIGLTSFWTFKKLKFHGMLIGKESYRQYYTMEPNDPFDEIKHQHALEKMREALRQEGYFNAEAVSQLKYDNGTKQIVAHVTLRKNERFGVADIKSEIKSDASISDCQRNEAEEIIQHHFLKKLDGGSYSKSSINKRTCALKRKLSQKGFIHVDVNLSERVDYEEHEVILSFVFDLHHKKEFIFTGNQFFSSERLLDSILEFGHSAWFLPSSILSDEIVQAYQKKGFWYVKVSSCEAPDNYIFEINEGERVSVKEVKVKNALGEDITKQLKGCFADFLKLKHYDVDTLKNALDRVTQWYLKEGFWDMKVLKQDFVLREYPGHQQLVLTIDEGQRSYLTALSIECWKELETQGPFSHLQKQDLHIPFDTQLLHDQRQWLLEYFRKQGYFHVEVKPDIQRNHGNVAVTWKVKLGESKVSFGKTVVVGTSRVPFEYIKRELQYHEGQIWDKDALKKTSAKLKNLEIFEGIHIYPDQVTKQEPEKAIMVKLQEDDPFEVRLRGGFALQNFTQQFSVDSLTYMAGGAFIFKNPFNKADQFKVDVDFARGHREVVAEYRLPWLFSQPIQTVFMGYSNKYFQPGFIGSKHNVYATTQHGFLVGFNRKFRAVDVGCNIGFELMNTESVVDKCALVEGVARAINFNKQLFDQSVPSFQLEPTMMIDLLDQQISPTKGLLTLLSLKGLFPLSRSSLNTYSIKALVEQSFFMPFRSVVGALRFRVGHIFHKEFSNIMPIERFYLGGANSLRSYDTDFASPLGSFIGDNGQCQYAPQGGKSMVNLNAELRFPIFKRLGGVVFQDLGALSSDGFATFDPRKVLFGTGFGLRLATPVGPLRFDIAWKLTKPDPSTRSYAWFLTFGQAF